MPGEILTAASIGTGFIPGFQETEGHATLGDQLHIQTSLEAIRATDMVALPAGSKVFIKSRDPERKDNVAHDEVGLILGHHVSGDHMATELVSLRPKDGRGWGVHNGYGGVSSETLDALAALDRLFDPERDSGSLSILSQTTGVLLDFQGLAPTIGLAGCQSHDVGSLKATLTYSQLFDTYSAKWPEYLRSDSGLVRREEDGSIIHYLPGVAHPEQPSRELRENMSIIRRADRLTGAESMLEGLSPRAVVRGLEKAIGRTDFMDPETPIVDMARTIRVTAEKKVA